MNRFLLALLALFTGLVAQAAPVQARMSGASDTEIGSVESARTGARPSAVQSQSLDAPVARQERRAREAVRIRPAAPRIYIPSVLFGADRAFE